MAGNSITLFGSDPPTGANSFVQDAFSDITDTPSSNAGWSSTISSNPMNNFYGNDDAPRYGPKTLWIQDLVLEPNRNNWVNGLPTYRIIWNEPFPSSQGYVYGDIQLIRNADQVSVQIKSFGSGFGVGGVFARCMALLSGAGAAGGSGQNLSVAVDGIANGISVSYGNQNAANPNVARTYFAVPMDSANEAYNIHDFRLTPNQVPNSRIEGVIVYSENPSLSIDQFPGSTYNNKTRSITTKNSTFPISSVGFTVLTGASFGGVLTLWKNQASGYSLSTIPHPFVSSPIINQAGSLLTVQTGTGASFNALDGLYAITSTGSTPWLGNISSISTDTLTVSPAPPTGLTGSVYRYFQAGSSYTINSSLNVLAMSFGATELSRWPIFGGFSNLFTQGQTGLFCYTDPALRFYVWGQGLGLTCINGYPALSINQVSSSWFQCEGYFSAADIEWTGAAGQTLVIGGSFSVNGTNGWAVSTNGSSGIYRQSVMADAPTGWNSFSYSYGGNASGAISRIGLWQRSRDVSASFGILGKIDILPQYVPRTANATLVAPGTFQRVYADQLMLTGPWTRTVGVTIPGGVMYQGSGTSCALGFNYFGTNFAVHGMSLGQGASLSYSLDGSANLGATSIGSVISAGSTFHSVSLSILGSGTTLSVWAVDFFRLYGEMKNLQTFTGITSLPVNPIPIMTRWMPYTMGFTGWGPGTKISAWSRRIGTDCEIKGVITPVSAGSVNATLAIFLPPGLVADGSNTPTDLISPLIPIPVGTFYASAAAAGVAVGLVTGATCAVPILASTPYAPYLTFFGSGQAGLIQLGSTVSFGWMTGGNQVGFQAKVTIAGWEVDR